MVVVAVSCSDGSCGGQLWVVEVVSWWWCSVGGCFGGHLWVVEVVSFLYILWSGVGSCGGQVCVVRVIGGG